MLHIAWAKIGLFAGGVLFGTAGVKLLSSQDAKKCYTNATAAVLRAKDSVMETVTTVRENCGDILADASFLLSDWRDDAMQIIRLTFFVVYVL